MKTTWGGVDTGQPPCSLQGIPEKKGEVPPCELLLICYWLQLPPSQPYVFELSSMHVERHICSCVQRLEKQSNLLYYYYILNFSNKNCGTLLSL